MNKYRVVWEIDVDAESEREAAEQARDLQRDDESLSTVYSVYDCRTSKSEPVVVDVAQPGEN
jgi:hypothetical protein